MKEKPLQILLVEDNAGDARLLREMFGDPGVVTPDSVVGTLHASQAAPAVEFRARTISFLESTMTLEPSGSLFSTKAFE